MEANKQTGPETASVNRISHTPLTGNSPMTQTARLLEDYLYVLGSLWDITEVRGFTSSSNQVARHLKAAGLANWIAGQIRLTKSDEYLHRARAHCNEVAPAIRQLQEMGKKSLALRVHQILNVELLAIRLEREFAYCSEDEERVQHIRTAEQRLTEIQALITPGMQPDLAIRSDWERTFLLALQSGQSQVAKTQATNLMRNVHDITQTMHGARRERALEIKQESLDNAMRIGIPIELVWKMPPKPTRKM